MLRRPRRSTTFALVLAAQLAAGIGLAANSKAPPDPPITIAFHSDPRPLRVGTNRFQVMLTDSRGKRVSDADVSLRLRMQWMPSMNAELPLTHRGDGIYRGSTVVPMAGQWAIEIVVQRDGTEIATRSVTREVK